MTWAFLYPFIGGVIFYLLLGLMFPEIKRFAGYRIMYNSYNSGIAVLTVGSILKGVMDIAGTSSSYLKLYTIIGYAFIVFGLVILILLAANYKKVYIRK
jgi:zinc transporter ZupT